MSFDPNARYVRIVSRTITVMEIYTSNARQAEYVDKDKIWQGEVQMGKTNAVVETPLRPATAPELALIDALNLEKRTTNKYPGSVRTYKL